MFIIKGNEKDYDILAEVPDLSERIIITTMKELKGYDDLMQDLILEMQEAY